ncbi:DUF3006 family protein [Megasphaera paucivorans]|uniref:DUF3006 domain-containing protein n=1 Tax=Megasphaera paucivorans TaxID=349095 RepID=A0A1G9VK48_9FIRM|nr:DUF3006 family protein [Megasphaera paucivorans]SDM72470.1 Protein of unknown function [Megasphaera paucivorans]
MKLIGSIDRITEQDAYIIVDDAAEHEIRIPLACLPQGADEGMAYTLEIIRNKEAEKEMQEEIELLHRQV